MIQVYGYKGELKRLAESLNATNVLSDAYSKEIFSMALNAYGDGYHAGMKGKDYEQAQS